MSGNDPAVAPPPAIPRANIPPLSRRLLVGGLRFIPLLLVWVVLPYGALRGLDSLGATSSLNLTTIELVGTLLAALSCIRYVLKPTLAFGPIGVVGSAITAVYLYVLSQSARFSVGGPSGVGIALEYGPILRLLAIVPILGVVAALVTTAEDLARPGERLPFDYPA